MKVYSDNIVNVEQFQRQNDEQHIEIEKLKKTTKLHFQLISLLAIVELAHLALSYLK